jgi:hypothetical protein
MNDGVQSGFDRLVVEIFRLNGRLVGAQATSSSPISG